MPALSRTQDAAAPTQHRAPQPGRSGIRSPGILRTANALRTTTQLRKEPRPNIPDIRSFIDDHSHKKNTKQTNSKTTQTSLRAAEPDRVPLPGPVRGREVGPKLHGRVHLCPQPKARQGAEMGARGPHGDHNHQPQRCSIRPDSIQGAIV